MRKLMVILKSLTVAVFVMVGAMVVTAAIPVIAALTGLLVSALFFAGVGFLAFWAYKEYLEDQGEL